MNNISVSVQPIGDCRVGRQVPSIRSAVSQVVASQQASHRVSHDVELHLGVDNPVAASRIFSDIGLLLENELVKASRVFDIVAKEVIGKLEAGEVIVSPDGREGRIELIVLERLAWIYPSSGRSRHRA